MRLSTEQLKAGWLHPSRIVRNAVAAHFTDTFTTDPDVTAVAIQAAREFGWERFLTWDSKVASLPLADDEALQWVCGEVERTDEAAPSNNLKWHLTTMLAKAEIPLLERHRERLLAVPGLQRRERQALRGTPGCRPRACLPTSTATSRQPRSPRRSATSGTTTSGPASAWRQRRTSTTASCRWPGRCSRRIHPIPSGATCVSR